MKSHKESCVKKFGYDPEGLETNLWFLNELIGIATIELDLSLRGKEDDFTNIEDLSSILAKYQLKDKHTVTSERDFSYTPLYNTVCEEAERIEYSTVSIMERDMLNFKLEKTDLALEMRLLRDKLDNVQSLSKREQKELLLFLVDLRKEYSEKESYGRYRGPCFLFAA
jgi:hypothetical protein